MLKVSSAREFQEKAPGMLRSRTPIVVTRRGRLAGVFFPQPETTLPPDLKRELFAVVSLEIQRNMNAHNVTEEEVLADFAKWRKKRRASRG